MSESKYEVAQEWYSGLAAVLQGTPRRLSESDHWIAGWDSGYKLRADTHDLLNAYLDSIGVKPMGIIKMASQCQPEQSVDANEMTREKARELLRRRRPTEGGCYVFCEEEIAAIEAALGRDGRE